MNFIRKVKKESPPSSPKNSKEGISPTKEREKHAHTTTHKRSSSLGVIHSSNFGSTIFKKKSGIGFHNRSPSMLEEVRDFFAKTALKDAFQKAKEKKLLGKKTKREETKEIFDKAKNAVMPPGGKTLVLQPLILNQEVQFYKLIQSLKLDKVFHETYTTNSLKLRKIFGITK